LDFVVAETLIAPQAASLPVRVPTIVSLLNASFQLGASRPCALFFATLAVTASDQFLAFDYIEPMSGTLA
jgi:hypothetical protein